MTIEVKGWIHESDFGESDDIVWVDDSTGNRVPLTEELDVICNKQVTVYYYITDQQCSLEQAQEQFLRSMYTGKADCEFSVYYSEITGYLWTDENLVIGGHDLLDEIRSHIGSYLLLEIEVHDTGSN